MSRVFDSDPEMSDSLALLKHGICIMRPSRSKRYPFSTVIFAAIN